MTVLELTTCTRCLTGMRWDQEVGRLVHLTSSECSGWPAIIHKDAVGKAFRELEARSMTWAEFDAIRRTWTEQGCLHVWSIGQPVYCLTCGWSR